ncbi:MAG: tetratricopeptide repeat protein, partial [Puniceicoccales bacterium]
GDNTLTLAALNDIKQYHGDDPGMSLMLIDYYILNEQYEDAIKAVERLEKYSGTPDAVLLSMRGNILLMNGDADAAIAVAREGIQAEPGEDDPYWTLADAQARSGEYASAVATFKQLESLFGYEFDYDYYRSQPDYEAFAKSPAFERWAAGE